MSQGHGFLLLGSQSRNMLIIVFRRHIRFSGNPSHFGKRVFGGRYHNGEQSFLTTERHRFGSQFCLDTNVPYGDLSMFVADELPISSCQLLHRASQVLGKTGDDGGRRVSLGWVGKKAIRFGRSSKKKSQDIYSQTWGNWKDFVVIFSHMVSAAFRNLHFMLHGTRSGFARTFHPGYLQQVGARTLQLAGHLPV